MGRGVNFQWRSDVDQAHWIEDRLIPFDSGAVTSVVPGGLESYARVLHPAEDASHGERIIRWAAESGTDRGSGGGSTPVVGS